ncbi:hypothetical protein D4R86_00885 [bacterium]|nr:MAG: hypothetical protein D4R86_00885 [bacterium]
MNATGATAALAKMQAALGSFAESGSSVLQKFAQKAYASLGSVFGILQQFKEGTKKAFAFGKETHLFQDLKSQLLAFQADSKRVVQNIVADMGRIPVNKAQQNLPIQKSERMLFKSIPDSTIPKMVEGDYSKLSVQYENLIQKYMEGKITLDETVASAKLLEQEVNIIEKYWKGVNNVLLAVNQKEQEVTTQLTLNNDISNQILKNKKGWVSVAGVIINTNSTIFKQYESFKPKVLEIQREEEQINKRYRTQVTLQKEVLDYLIRNKKPLMEIEAQKNRIITLERKHLSELEKVRSKAMEINKTVSKGDAYSQIFGNLDKQSAAVNLQRKSNELSNELINKDKSRVVIADTLISKQNAYYANNKNIQASLSHINDSYNITKQYYDKVIKSKREGLELMRKEKVGAELVEAGAQDILNLEKRRNVELDKIRQEALKIERIMSGGGSRAEVKKLEADELTAELDKQKIKEDKITDSYRKRVEVSKFLVEQNKNLVAIAGVEINKKSAVYMKYEKIRQAVADLDMLEQKINQTYDKRISKERQTIEQMTKQGRSVEVINAAHNRVLELERKRNVELDKISAEMRKISEINSKDIGTKKKRAEVEMLIGSMSRLTKNMRENIHATSTLGIANDAYSASSIRMGGATTGIIRTFSRWRNRILVLTFALAGVIRSMKRFIEMSAEVGKQQRSLEVVATNLGLSINKVQKAAEYLARDGVISIAEATQAMKSLLSMGASLDVVVNNLEMMKDAAMAMAGQCSLLERI